MTLSPKSDVRPPPAHGSKHEQHEVRSYCRPCLGHVSDMDYRIRDRQK